MAACLVGIAIVVSGAAAASFLSGSADVTAPVLLLLTVALAAAFLGPVVSSPLAAGVEKGICGVISVLLLTVGAVLGAGWFTGAIGTASAYAVQRTHQRQLTARLGLVAVAAVVAHPLCDAFGGIAWVALPVALAVAAIAGADALTSARRGATG